MFWIWEIKFGDRLHTPQLHNVKYLKYLYIDLNNFSRVVIVLCVMFSHKILNKMLQIFENCDSISTDIPILLSDLQLTEEMYIFEAVEGTKNDVL